MSEDLIPIDPKSLDNRSPYFPSLISLQAAHSEYLKLHRERGDISVFLAEINDFIRRGRSTGIVLDEENDRKAAQSILDYWSGVLNRAGRQPPDTTLTDFNPDLAPDLNEFPCPYRGLYPFGEANHINFFGRQRLVEEMVQHLQDNRLLAAIGHSGSGKSSVVLAGLLPALKKGVLAGSETWYYYSPMVPGSDPLAKLAQILRPPGASASEWNRSEIARLRQESGELLRRANEVGVPTVLIVDQFEEVFTLCHDTQARQAFVDNLLGLILAPHTRHTLILTMRADFEASIAQLPALWPLFEKSTIRVTPLSAGELREAIEGPAATFGLKFEEGVVNSLIQDILGEPTALPLLQFTLIKLWEARNRNWVTWEAYRRLGSARLALVHSAEEFYQKLIPEDQFTVRRILMRMVRLYAGLEVTSNRIRRDSLYEMGEDRVRVDRVLDKLVDARLIRLTEGETPANAQVEVAHEALVRNWPRLAEEWLGEERDTIRRRQRVTDAAEYWKRLDKNPDLLLSATLLQEAQRVVDDSSVQFNELEQEFLEKSRAALQHIEAEREAARKREEELRRLEMQLAMRDVRLVSNSTDKNLSFYDKSWAFIIGINEYEQHTRLLNARNDATAMARLLEDEYKFDHVLTLYDSEATYKAIVKMLRDDLRTTVGRNDRLVFFFAGHGTTIKDIDGRPRGYLIPQDAEKEASYTYINMTEVLDACGIIPAKHILIILDCCFSGVVALTRATTPSSPREFNNAYLEEITKRRAWQVLTASAEDELAADSGRRPGHSAFTGALLAGLEGAADGNSDDLITATDLANFVRPEVIKETKARGGKGQMPYYNYLQGSEQGDFVFVRRKPIVNY